ncbi:MAG: hypothetical protein HRF49_06165 [bacterium]
MTGYLLIAVIRNPADIEKILSAAAKAGAPGATVISARRFPENGERFARDEFDIAAAPEEIFSSHAEEERIMFALVPEISAAEKVAEAIRNAAPEADGKEKVAITLVKTVRAEGLPD